MNTALKKTAFPALHFLLHNTPMCVDLRYITKVLPLALLENVPGSQPYFVGLLNLAGKSIPIIDLAICLGLPRNKPYSLDIPILLCSEGARELGIVVDEVTEIMDVENNNLQMQREFNQANSPFLATVARGAELVLLVDIKQIVDCALYQA